MTQNSENLFSSCLQLTYLQKCYPVLKLILHYMQLNYNERNESFSDFSERAWSIPSWSRVHLKQKHTYVLQHDKGLLFERL